eukprot:5439259-Pleurochrysis_carterae.AAC.2
MRVRVRVRVWVRVWVRVCASLVRASARARDGFARPCPPCASLRLCLRQLVLAPQARGHAQPPRLQLARLKRIGLRARDPST